MLKKEKRQKGRPQNLIWDISQIRKSRHLKS
jgi:hypothetical protein